MMTTTVARQMASALEGQMTMDMLFCDVSIGASEEARLLTLSELSSLKMSTPVWVEERNHPWETDQSRDARFFRLYQAKFVSIGIPYGKVRRDFHFQYRRDRHVYSREYIETFYDKEWRVWIGKPTDAQREATLWILDGYYRRGLDDGLRI